MQTLKHYFESSVTRKATKQKPKFELDCYLGLLLGIFVSRPYRMAREGRSWIGQGRLRLCIVRRLRKKQNYL